MGGVCSAAIESENVVGYSTSESNEASNFRTVAFNTLGCNTADIQQIKISDNNAGGIGWGTETFSIWEGAPTVVEGSGFVYYDPSMDPNGEAKDYYWGDASGNKAEFSIAVGQGVVIECAADLDVSTSGEVPCEVVTFTTVDGSNFTGNPFSAPMSIQNIAISDGDVGGIGWGTETFSIWEGAPTVVEGSGFVYYDASMDPNGEATGYYWGDATGNAASFMIPVGQGVVVECGADLTVTITPPYSL